MVEEFEMNLQTLTDKGMVLIKNEDICIRCGLCAKRCPAGTIKMEAFQN